MTKTILISGTWGLESDLWWKVASPFWQAAKQRGIELAAPDDPFVWTTALEGVKGDNREWACAAAALRWFCKAKGIERPNIVAHCFDQETEVLTPTGWQRQDKINVGSPILTYNRVKNYSEFEPVSAVHRYDDLKTMISCHGRMIDLMVTPEHGMWAGVGATLQGQHIIAWQEASIGRLLDRLNNSWFVVRNAARQIEREIPVTDSWLRLLAWIMAEGNIQVKNGRISWIRLSQSDAPDGRLTTILNDIEACGIQCVPTKRYNGGEAAHGTYRNWDAYILGLKNPSIYGPIVQRYFGLDKTPADILWSLSGRQAEIFLERYVMADGSKTWNHSYQISAKRKDHIDFLQSLVTRLGYRSHAHVRPPRFGRTGIVWCLSFSKNHNSAIVSIKKDKVQVVPYDGISWCVTTPNGTVLVRRNGCTAITLNSHGGQVALLATGQGLDLETLITVATPVRGDVLSEIIRPKIQLWIHIHTGAGDRMQLLGAVGDGEINARRKMPDAENICEPDQTHSGLMDSDLWTARGWWEFLR